MLAKKYKLTRKDDIPNILEEGKEIKSQYFVIKYTNSDHEDNRFAIVVSSKISKKAVTRNRLRRQIFEIIRLNPEKISEKSPKNIIILVRKPILELKYEDLETQLLKTLSKL